MTAAVLALATTATAAFGVLNNHSPACRPKQGRLIAADARAEVYLTRRTKLLGRFPAYVGCVHGARWAAFVGSPPSRGANGAGGTRRITLAGDFVAYEEFVTVRRPRERLWTVTADDLRIGYDVHLLGTGACDSTSSKLLGVGRRPGSWSNRTVRSRGSCIREKVHTVWKRWTRPVATSWQSAPISLRTRWRWQAARSTGRRATRRRLRR